MSVFPREPGEAAGIFNRIGFHATPYGDLVDEYGRTADAIDNAQLLLASLVTQAHHLLEERPTTFPATTLNDIAEKLSDEQTDLRRRHNALQAADARTAFLLAVSKDRLINVEFAADALWAGQTYDEALLHFELEQLQSTPRPRSEHQLERITFLEAELATLARPFSFAGIQGDLDGDLLTPRVGSPLRFSFELTTGTERARFLVQRALNDTADADQIQRDEFQAYFHDNGNLTLVLPGVIDLSNPRFGIDPETQSLRDLDQHAASSSLNTELADNGYGRRIADWTERMVDSGVIPYGTETAIIGHSFGGDTALDLTADAHFNGELLNVTHALSAGYNSHLQLEQLPEHTRALAMFNIYDAVVIGERIIAGSNRRPIDRVAYEIIEEGANGLTGLFRRGGSQHRLELEEERVVSVRPNGLLAEFEGGLQGAGHHQDEYIEYVERLEDPAIIDFFNELDSFGFTSDAVAVSIDISAPEEAR